MTASSKIPNFIIILQVKKIITELLRLVFYILYQMMGNPIFQREFRFFLGFSKSSTYLHTFTSLQSLAVKFKKEVDMNLNEH